jgi:hypothetical protein
MSRPKCPTPCRRASTPITAGAAAPGAQPCGPGSWAIAPPMPLLAPVRRTRQRWSCINRWYPWRGSGRRAALGRLRCWLSSRRQPSRTGGVRPSMRPGAMGAVACAWQDKERPWHACGSSTLDKDSRARFRKLAEEKHGCSVPLHGAGDNPGSRPHRAGPPLLPGTVVLAHTARSALRCRTARRSSPVRSGTYRAAAART